VAVVEADSEVAEVAGVEDLEVEDLEVVDVEAVDVEAASEVVDVDSEVGDDLTVMVWCDSHPSLLLHQREGGAACQSLASGTQNKKVDIASIYLSGFILFYFLQVLNE